MKEKVGRLPHTKRRLKSKLLQRMTVSLVPFGLLLIVFLGRPETIVEHHEKTEDTDPQRSKYSPQPYLGVQAYRAKGQEWSKGAHHVEITSVWNQTTASTSSSSVESPYGTVDFHIFGPQYGIITSEDLKLTELPCSRVISSTSLESIESPYGKAEVPLFGPQYGIPGFSPLDDYYNDSDEDRRDKSKSAKFSARKVESQIHDDL